MISKYCEECLKFRQKECKGKPKPKLTKYWGQTISIIDRVLFCDQYIFDERLYKFPDGSGKPDSFEVVRERQVEKEVENLNEEAFNDFDLGMSLSSKDFEFNCEND